MISSLKRNAKTLLVFCGSLLITLLAHAQAIDTTFNYGKPRSFFTDPANPMPGIGTDSHILISSITLQPDGKALVVGEFSSYNGKNCNSIIRLNADGRLDPTFNSGTGFNSYPYGIKSVLIQGDGKILVAGKFRTNNGNIARLNSDGTLDNTFRTGIGTNDYINAIALQPDGKIIITGNFTSYNGVTRNRIARLFINGDLDYSFNPNLGPNNAVLCVALQTDGKIIIGGEFATYNGTTRKRIARLNSDGSLDSSFAPTTGANGDVLSLAVLADGRIMVGGYFNDYNGTSVKNMVRLMANGILDTTFDSALPYYYGTFRMFKVQPDAKIIVCIYISEDKQVFRLNSDGSIDNTFSPPAGGYYGDIYTIAPQANGAILAGGLFERINNSIYYSGIARFNTDGNPDLSYNSRAGATEAVHAIALQPDGKMLIGGRFVSYNGVRNNRIARLNEDGSLDKNFNLISGPDDEINSLIIQPNGKILVGGLFTTVNDTPRNRIARLNEDGSLDLTFNPGTGFNSDVISIQLQSNGKILVSGRFTMFDGTSCNRLVRLNEDGSIDNSFNPAFNTSAQSCSILLQSDGKILVLIPSSLVRLNPDGSIDNTFSQTPLNLYPYYYSYPYYYPLQSLAIQPDGKILVGGYRPNAESKGLIRFNSNGTLDSSFQPAVSADVYSVALQSNDKIIISGRIDNNNGNFARLNPNGSKDDSFDSNEGTDSLSVYTMVNQPDGKLLIGGNFTSYDGTSAGGIVRILTGSVQTVTFNALPAKSYGNAPFNLTGTASSGLPVTYTSSNTSVATVNGNTVTLIGAGTTVITAQQVGNPSYIPTEAKQTLTVNKGSQSITFPAITNKIAGDAPFNITTTSTSGLPVMLSSTSVNISIKENQITIVKSGRTTITANQPGNVNYNAATNEQRSFCINPAKPNITTTSSGENITLTSSSSSGNQWFKNGLAINGSTNNTFTATASGVYQVQVSTDDCISVLSDSQSLIITGDIESSSKPASLLYPNPATKVVVISFEEFDANEKVAVKIIDSYGRIMSTTNSNGLPSISIDVSNLSDGTYSALLQQNNKLATHKFIKSHK